MRCPRCNEHDLALETFAVPPCAHCGVMPIDGEPIRAPEPPEVITTGTTSFAAPPRGAAPARAPRAQRPGIIFTLVAVEVILCIAKALVPGVASMRVAMRASAVGAVVVWTSPAYRYALTALGGVILLDTVHLPAPWETLTPPSQIIVALLALVDLVFVGALLSPAARRHYEAERD